VKSDRVAAAVARMNVGGDGGEHQDESARAHRIRLSPSLVVSSSLAASCSSLVASFLGVAGTIAGAAIGSVVATTGTAFYGHALRKGGKRIVERLGPNTVVSEMDSQTTRWTQTEIALAPGADAKAGADAETAASTSTASVGPSHTPPKTAYRKSIALAVAMLAVFGAAITVGLLAGGPIRQAGTGYNFTRAQPVTSGNSAAPSSGHTGSSTATATPEPGSSASTSAVASSTAPASGSAATTGQSAANSVPSGGATQ